MSRYRSHTCEILRKKDAGKNVRLAGWVHRIRDHGGLLFIDLRDHWGRTQIVVDPTSNAFQIADQLRSEWVVCVEGEVKERAPEAVNPSLSTGEVELYASKIEVLSAAQEVPVPVFGEADYPEDLRLKYRFLDLRRETLHKNIMKRTQIIAAMRRHMQENDFTEFSTPILTASSPEGARDFLVPSRMHAGKFYALPQAPQQYKQLLMASGFDRYFQIAPCFRDEDPRADRLPGEFYQLDVEMSFVEQEDILTIMEPIIRAIFEEFSDGKKVSQKFLRLPYAEALAKYGCDKPDLRNPIILQDVSEYFLDSGFKVFDNILKKSPTARIWAVPAKTGGSRAFCDRMNQWAQAQGQAGLGYIFWRQEEEHFSGAGPIATNIGEERCENLRKQLGLAVGDACFFIAGEPKTFMPFAAQARTKIGEELNLIEKDQFALAWIVDFPFYEWDEKNKCLSFSHNPFSMPQGGMQVLEEQDPLTIKAFQFDIVCNGYEIASGGIRNHSSELMLKAFDIVGMSAKDVEENFGALYRAFHYGAPPHGGMAAGIDRIIMLLLGAKTVRDICLFPMNQQAADLLMNAPAPATAEQLEELSLRIAPLKKL